MALDIEGDRSGLDPGKVTLASPTIRFTQSNLHHSKSASAVLVRSLAKVHTGLALIQEPWIRDGEIRGLGGGGRLFCGPVDSPRTCILVKGLEAEILPDHCSRDLKAIRIRFILRGVARWLVVGSAYFPYDSEGPPPPEEVKKLIAECESKGVDLVLGCDANSHNVVWGSSDCNTRGIRLLEYLVTTNLDVLNVGCKPTFRNAVREEVIDITLVTRGLWGMIDGWRVSDEVSMSDHNHIVFEISEGLGTIQRWRNPRKTNWAAYVEELAAKLSGFMGQLKSWTMSAGFSGER